MDEYIRLVLPRGVTAGYAAWVDSQVAGGLLGPGSTHGVCARLCREALRNSLDANLIQMRIPLSLLDSWFNQCLKGTDQPPQGMATGLHVAWRHAATASEPKMKPPEPIDPAVMAHIRSLSVAEIEDVPLPKPATTPSRSSQRHSSAAPRERSLFP